MKKNVLVVLANKPFLDYAKQLFSAAYWKAGWKGDYLLLAHECEPEDTQWFEQKGIIVKHCPTLTTACPKKLGPIIASKLYIFSDYFKQWDHVIYLDVDIIIRGPLDGLCGVDEIGACHSLGQTVRDNLQEFDKIDNRILSDLKKNYDLSADSFNAGVLSFNTNIITDTMLDGILSVYNKYIQAALFTDQTILNLYFQKGWEGLPIVYNRTVEKSAYEKIDPVKFEGIIIHTVSTGDGPWNLDNIFHKEWLENFEKADLIDLSNIPDVKPWSREKIEKQSRNIIKAHVWGHDRNFFSFLKKAVLLIITKPSRAFIKIRQFFKMLLIKE